MTLLFTQHFVGFNCNPIIIITNSDFGKSLPIYVYVRTPPRYVLQYTSTSVGAYSAAAVALCGASYARVYAVPYTDGCCVYPPRCRDCGRVVATTTARP